MGICCLGRGAWAGTCHGCNASEWVLLSAIVCCHLRLKRKGHRQFASAIVSGGLLMLALLLLLPPAGMYDGDVEGEASHVPTVGECLPGSACSTPKSVKLGRTCSRKRRSRERSQVQGSRLGASPAKNPWQRRPPAPVHLPHDITAHATFTPTIPPPPQPPAAPWPCPQRRRRPAPPLAASLSPWAAPWPAP